MSIRANLLNSSKAIWDMKDFSGIQHDFIREGVVDNFDELEDLETTISGNIAIIKKGTCYIRCIFTKYWDINPLTMETIEKEYSEAVSHTVRFTSNADISLDVPENTSGSDLLHFVIAKLDVDTEPNELATNVGEVSILEDQTAGSDAPENSYKLAEISVSASNEITVTDSRQKVRFKNVMFDPEDGHEHDGNDAPKIKGENIVVVAYKELQALNVRDQIKELEDKKSDTDHKHILTDITDIERTAQEINEQLPSEEQKAAMDNSSLPPASSNPFATEEYAKNLVQSAVGGGGKEVIFEDDEDLEIEVYDQDTGRVEEIIRDEDEKTEGEKSIQSFFSSLDYPDFYKTITKMEDEAGESYTSGSFSNVYYKEGTQTRLLNLSSDSTSSIVVEFGGKDCSGFNSSDRVVFWVYAINKDNLDLAEIRVGSGSDLANNYIEKVFTSEISKAGWNRIIIPISDFSETGSFDSSNISSVRFEGSTTISGTAQIYFDFIQFQKNEGVLGGVFSDPSKAIDIVEFGGEPYACDLNHVFGVRTAELIPVNQKYEYKNLEVFVDLAFGSGESITKRGGVDLRRIDDDNRLRFLFENDGTVTLKEVINGTETVLINAETGVSYSPETPYRVICKASGSTVSIGINEVIYEEAETAHIEKGTVALSGNTGKFGFKDFEVKTISETFSKSSEGDVVRIYEKDGFGDRFTGYDHGQETLLFLDGSDDADIDGELDESSGVFALGVSGTRTSDSITATWEESISFSEYDIDRPIPSSDKIGIFCFYESVAPSSVSAEFFLNNSSLGIISFDLSEASQGLNYITASFPSFLEDKRLFNKVVITTDSEAVFSSLLARKNSGLFGIYDIENEGFFLDDKGEETPMATQAFSGNEERILAVTIGTNEERRMENQILKCSILKGDGGVCFRMQQSTEEDANGDIQIVGDPENNFYAVIREGNYVSLRKKENGSWTEIGDQLEFLNERVYIYVEADSENFKFGVSEDNELYTLSDTFSDATFSDGKVGIISINGITTFEEFRSIEITKTAPFTEIKRNENGTIISQIKK